MGGECAARQFHPQLQNVPVDESHRGLVPRADIAPIDRECANSESLCRPGSDEDPRSERCEFPRQSASGRRKRTAAARIRACGVNIGCTYGRVARSDYHEFVTWRREETLEMLRNLTPGRCFRL